MNGDLSVSDLSPTQAHGTYILIMWLSVPVELTVGKLGMFSFAAGWYAYVGSAFGAGGLRGRLGHHLGHGERLHWHIDYLSRTASITEIWYLASETPQEHAWAAVLSTLPDMTIPIRRFGASDCKCPSHLFYCPAPPSFDAFHALTQAQGDVRCWQVVAGG